MKPDNIFIHEEEDKTLLYKIGDFGMCRSFPASNIEEGDSRYLAPEMLTLGKDDQEVDLPKVDIFAFGSSILEVVETRFNLLKLLTNFLNLLGTRLQNSKLRSSAIGQNSRLPFFFFSRFCQSCSGKEFCFIFKIF